MPRCDDSKMDDRKEIKSARSRGGGAPFLATNTFEFPDLHLHIQHLQPAIHSHVIVICINKYISQSKRRDAMRRVILDNIENMHESKVDSG